MNTDCTKPTVAPKTRFVCHSTLRLPSPLMSTPRGPKPTIAPKPQLISQMNGYREGGGGGGGGGGGSNGCSQASDGEAEEEEEEETQSGQFHSSALKSPLRHVQNVSRGLEDGEVAAEEKGMEEEEQVNQKMDEDWRLSDSVLTEEPDSLETLWVSAELTSDPKDLVEMMDLTEDMTADGGEALADTDGLLVGDLSQNSIDEDAGGSMKVKLQIREEEAGDCTADDLTESLTDEPEHNTKDPPSGFLTDGEEKEEEPVSDHGHILKLHRGCEKKENIRFYDFIPEDHRVFCDTAEKHVSLEAHLIHEPYYVSSDDIIDSRPDGLPDVPQTTEIKQDSEDYVQVVGRDESKTSTCHKGFRSEAHTTQAFLNNLDYQPRFRLVSISVPTDNDTSLTGSDVFGEEDDLDGHIIPFLDDDTDPEQDEHVYEEPRQSSGGETIFPLDRKTTRMQPRSLSHRTHNSVAEAGVQFVQSTYMSGFGQPALSSSPMPNPARHNSYSKPHYLYPRSLSMEAQDSSLCLYRDRKDSQERRAAVCSSGSFSRCSPLSSSGPTSVVDIPPPFELAYITKRPITKSSPSLLIDVDSSEKNRKKKSSIKRFLMLKFRRKTESKSVVDVSPTSCKSSLDCTHHTPTSRILDMDRHSLSRSPHLNSHRSACQPSTEHSSNFLFYKESKRKGNSVAFLNRSVIRVESFEDRSRVPFIPLPLTKPRSISFPNTDTSDYENVPTISSDYENVQVPQQRAIPQGPFADFFDRPTSSRVLTSSANDTDGYVDMSSLLGFKSRTQSPQEETESAYTEAYNVCSVAISPPTGSSDDVRGETAAEEEEQEHTSDEEDGGADTNYIRQVDGRSRAFYVAKELVDTERMHVKALKLLQEDFREAVGAAVGDEGEPVVEEERLQEILNELPDVYTLHRRILSELENRLRHWEESQRIADIFLCRRAEFLVFTTYIGHYDRSMNLLEDSCRTSPCFAAIVHQFEQQQNPVGEKVSLKQQLLQVIVRVAQYRMLLTDYLNNLSPDSKEYEDTQAAVAIVSDIEDQVNDSLQHGENLLRLVNIEYSVHGQRELLQPGRVFVKEGTLMKVSRKSQQPRHLFLMNDVLLYTYPQQDGKYRLKNTLPLTGLKVSKPIVENIQNALRIEGSDISITLSASSFIEREDWFYTLSRTVTEHSRGCAAFNGCSAQARDRLHLSLGEKPPTLVPVSQVMMCMNCTSDFSLTLRRHHCHGCGRIVCRSCSRNRYPLKYMKDRMAKVCDHCYTELKRRGGDVSPVSAKGSPRPHRSSRPLSSVFQNIHPPNIWRHRKGAMSFNQVTVSEEGSISGSLHRSKKSKRNWKRLWFLLKDKVLYTFRAEEEKVASETLPLLGFTVKLPDRHVEEATVFQLYHKNTLYYTFRAEDNYTAQRWVNAMEEATVL